MASKIDLQLSTAELTHQERYKLLVGCVVPRPIAWITTLSPEGVANLAPFSFYGVASDSPPVLMFNTNWREGGAKKDTLRNVEATGEFVVNVVDESLLTEVQMSSWEYAPEVDEIERLLLSPIPSRQVRPPSLADTKASMECRVVGIKYFSDAPHHSSAVFGEVVHWRVQRWLLDEGRMRFDRLRPLARLAGNRFSGPGPIIEAAPARELLPGDIAPLSRRRLAK